MSQSTEVKYCPFCSSVKAPRLLSFKEIACLKDSDSDRSHSQEYAICCDFQNGGCGTTGGYDPDKIKALHIWNQRSDPTSAFRDLPPRPVKMTRLLDVMKCTTTEGLEHYQLLVDYWIAEAKWQEMRADRLNRELSAFLKSASP